MAFASADGSIHLAATADKESPNGRVKRAVDTGRLTIAPRAKPHAPLKPADFTAGRSSGVVAFGANNFAFAKADGRVNSLTPGGIAVHLPAKAAEAISALAIALDGTRMAYVCGARITLTATVANEATHFDAPAAVTALEFSPDGQVLAAGHAGGLSRWRIDTPDQPVLTPMASAPTGIIWRADAAWLGCLLQGDGFALIDLTTDHLHVQTGFPAPVGSLGFGLSTNTVAASGAFRVAAWDLADQGAVLSGKAGLLLIDRLAVSPTRNLVAVGYANGLLSLAEIGRPSEILLREDTGAGFTAMAWSANGTYLAMAGTDGSAALIEFPESMFKS